MSKIKSCFIWNPNVQNLSIGPYSTRRKFLPSDLFYHQFLRSSNNNYHEENCLSVSLSIYLSTCGSAVLLLYLGRIFSLRILYTVGRTLGLAVSPFQGRYLYREQHKHRINAHTDIHASSRIRTHDPMVRAGEDSSRFRPHDHCNRQGKNYDLFKI
jgi:hypothetical protein